ncbi:MAG: class I tRNA ligase family protein, partial [Pseudomonadota bacterium]
NFSTKLWNAARFGELNECTPVEGFDPASVSQPLNRWIVGETGRLRAAVDAALEGYRFNDAASALYGDVWGVFCDWYVELSKPLLSGEDAAARDETRAALAWALDARLKLLHPFMPFVTEALWEQRAARPAMLAVTDWPEIGPEAADAAADAEIGRVTGLIEAIRSVRAEMNVPPSAKLPLVLTEGGAALEAAIREALPLVERLARVEGFEVGEAPKGSVTVPLEGGAAALPLAGVVDGAKEKARLEKALAKVEKEAGGLVRKLENPGFLAKAPEEVVEENRERLEAAREEATRLKAAAERAAALV